MFQFVWTDDALNAIKTFEPMLSRISLNDLLVI
jgi:hypothetical protein